MLNSLNDIYRNIFFSENPLMNSSIRIALIFAVGVIVWWVFNFLLRRFKRAYEKTSFFQENDRIFFLIKKAGHYCILLLIGSSVVNFIHLLIIEKIFYALMVLLLAAFVNDIVRDLIPYLEQTISTKTKTGVDDVIFGLLRRFATVIIFATAIILALDQLGVNIMPFIAGAGVAGIAIGFAAKDTLSNIIAGILLIIDRPFEVGDRIEVWTAPKNSATWGDVIDVGLRATRIRTTDNIVIVIPNNEIMKRDIINYTSISDEIRVRIPIGVAYDADIAKAKEIITGISMELEWVMKDPPPKVVVKNFGDSAVNLEVRVWISKPRRRMDTISHITDRTKEEFSREGIEIPFPKRDIYIKREV